jgi:hypothetical protein
VPEQIADGDDAFFRQRGATLGPDARQSGDGGRGVDQSAVLGAENNTKKGVVNTTPAPSSAPKAPKGNAW